MDSTQKELVLYRLASIVNESESFSNDAAIAKAFIELRDEIDQWSQAEIAQKYFVSQSSISRFIQRLGYSGFTEIRGAINKSSYLLNLLSQPPSDRFEETRQNVYNTLKNVTEDMMKLDGAQIVRMTQTMRQFRCVYFMGSDFSMQVVRLLQHKLLSSGIESFTLYKPQMQKSILERAKEDELVIMISLGKRWYLTEEIGSSLDSCACKKMLWTVAEDHPDLEKFDWSVMMGKTDDGNIGYHYLMQFVLIVGQLL